MRNPIETSNTSILSSYDRKEIQLVENRDPGHPAPNRLIISHGLGDKPRGWLSIVTARYFADHGFDVVRFGYYGSEPNLRKLHECTLADHERDLADVICQGRHGYDRTFVLGHSWGGFIAAMTRLDPDVDGLILVDPTFMPGWPKDTIKLNDQFWILNWGRSSLVRDDYCQEAENFAKYPHIMEDQATEIQSPVLTILAGAGQKPGRHRDGWHNALPDSHDKTLVVIEGADHEFTIPGTAEKMLDTAHEWILSLNK